MLIFRGCDSERGTLEIFSAVAHHFPFPLLHRSVLRSVQGKNYSNDRLHSATLYYLSLPVLTQPHHLCRSRVLWLVINHIFSLLWLQRYRITCEPRNDLQVLTLDDRGVWLERGDRQAIED